MATTVGISTDWPGVAARSAAEVGPIQSIAADPMIIAARRLIGTTITEPFEGDQTGLNSYGTMLPNTVDTQHIAVTSAPASSQKPTPIMVLLPPPPLPPGATASWRARGASGAGLTGRGCSRSAWRFTGLRRAGEASSSSFL